MGDKKRSGKGGRWGGVEGEGQRCGQVDSRRLFKATICTQTTGLCIQCMT